MKKFIISRWLFLMIIAFASPSYNTKGVDIKSPNIGDIPAPVDDIPLLIENVGQFPNIVRFQIYGLKTNIWLTENAIWFSLPLPGDIPARSTSSKSGYPLNRDGNEINKSRILYVKYTFPGSNLHPQIEPIQAKSSSISYMKGSRSLVRVPVWSGVIYKNIYPDIDLEIMTSNTKIIPKVVIKSGGYPAVFKLRIEGPDVVSIHNASIKVSHADNDFSLPLFEIEGAIDNLEPTVTRLDNESYTITSPFIAHTGGESTVVKNYSGQTDINCHSSG